MPAFLFPYTKLCEAVCVGLWNKTTRAVSLRPVVRCVKSTPTLVLPEDFQDGKIRRSVGAAGRGSTCQRLLDPDEKGGCVTGRLIPPGHADSWCRQLLRRYGPAEVAERDHRV